MTSTPLPRSRSLRWTILPQLAIVTTLVIGCGLGMVLVLSVQQHDSDLAKRAQTIADFIIYAAETSPSFADLQRFVASSGGSPDINWVAVAVGDPPRVVAASRHAWIGRPFETLTGEAPLPRNAKTLIRRNGTRTLLYVAPIRTGIASPVPGRTQEGAVMLELDSRPHVTESRRLVVLFGSLLGICILAIAVGTWLLLRFHVLEPLARLRDAMHFRAWGNADAFVASRTPGEVGDLSRTYDDMLVTLRDRERELAASEIAERAARANFSAFFNHSVDLLCVLDLDGAFITANATLLSRLGYSMEELQGQPVLKIHPPKRHEEAGRIVRDMLEGRADKCPVPLQAKDGRLIPVETRIVRGTWDGQPALFGISKDITDLALSEEKFSKAFQSGASMMAISTLEEGRYLDVNQAFLNGIGIARTAVIGSTAAELGILRHAGQRAALVARFKAAGRLRNEELEYRTAAGVVRHGLFSMESIYVGDSPCILTVMTDITERKQHERALLDHKAELERQVAERTAALIQAQKMESVGRLAGGIAHDFNNCLYCIHGFSELLLETLPAEFPQRHYVQEILRAAQQATDVTRQLLAFSRQQFIHPTRADINTLVTNQQKMLRRLLGEDIRIELELQPGEAPAVVDPSQFQQVLMNLCVNARDAMYSGGVLTIGTHVLRVAPPPAAGDGNPGHYVRVSVTDTGCGMTPETQARIFEPFFTTKVEGKGTGLGLPVVLGIVQQHGGWIEVASTPGAGTRFEVFFPAADQAAEIPAPPAPAPASAPQGKCVLLVEDDRKVRTLAAIRLRAMGHRVIEAENVSGGLLAFREARDKIEILLSDVVLPDGTGVTLAETVAAEAPAVRIIFSSGYADERSRIKEIHARGWSFITKPYTREALAALLREADAAPEPRPA